MPQVEITVMLNTPLEERQFIGIGYVAQMLGVNSDDVIRLINDGMLNADANHTGDILLFKMSDVLACKAKMKGER
jgi:hypothetical protein